MSLTSVTVEHDVVTATLRPRYEGSNIRTWIGFKHLMYLVEEGVLEWFRQHDLGPQRLYHERGLGLEIVESSVQLSSLLEIDDLVQVETRLVQAGDFVVTLRVQRPHGITTAVRGKIKVALVERPDVAGDIDSFAASVGHAASVASAASVAPAAFVAPATSSLAAVSAVVRSLTSTDARDLTIRDGDAPAAALAELMPRALCWAWPARYFYCHYSDRVQLSAYVRALEEGADRYLAARGLSIRRMLDERGWIPVVSRARVRVLGDAWMEETIHSTFAVGEIVKDVAYECRLDCYAERGTTLAHVATATMLQGYARSRGDDAGRLVTLDADTRRALTAS